jgi:hypothetical protein
MAWLSGWSKRIKLTIDHTKVDANLTHFPVTVILSSSQGEEVFTELGSDANRFKIAFTKADGETQLYAEIEQFDYASSKAVFHVSKSDWVISSSTDDDFYLYYDAEHADNTDYIGDIDSTPGHAVWDSDFEVVYHMVDATTSSVKDSTSNGVDGTKYASNQPVQSSSGKIGNCQSFDGNDDYIYNADPAAVEVQTLTVEMLAKTEDYTETLNGGISKGLMFGSASTRAWQLQIHNSNVSWSGLTISTTLFSVSDGIDDNNWHYWCGTCDTSNAYLWKDSTKSAPSNYSGSIYYGGSYQQLSVGNRVGGAYALNGLMDEVRISSVARSDAWIKATYNSLWDSLLTYGDEEESTGDVTLSIPVLASSAAMFSTLNLQLAPPAMAGQGTLSMDSASIGRYVQCEPFSSVSSLAGKLNLNLALPVLGSQAGLNGNPVIQLLSPAFTAQGNLFLADIFLGFYVDIPAFSSTGALSCNTSIQLLTPSLAGQGGLSVAPCIQLLLDPFTALASLGMASINRFNTENAEIKYTFILTGENDGTTDITIPISSFQARLRSGDPTYLSIVVPGVDYASAISARPNGEMIVSMQYYSGGLLLQTEEIIRADLEDINISEGAQNKSIVLTGHKTQTTGGKTVTLRNPTYRNLYQGKYTYRCATPDIFLRPGDTVVCGEDSFTANLITYVVSVAQQSMEVSE